MEEVFEKNAWKSMLLHIEENFFFLNVEGLAYVRRINLR